ncbi:S9 family peptidase [Flavihumibacter petaseus]|uniref:Peptidase S9 family protein n=1 Tax=Flavihumibacter petaseus NBRC 106054 TaxID=1220578 RepID=A0A0E9N703_9BACT|nr:prolyl oligopeptidase family serine peptidase [Flavihumibacter petaseus]GAO45727.1 peptidase S9 family protein [Flavihumibacter petaseus NBRC 106054]
MKYCFLLSLLIAPALLPAQQPAPALTVEYIMRDPKWIGTSPSSPWWSAEGQLYFSWNPEKNLADSLYTWPGAGAPKKVSLHAAQEIVDAGTLKYNAAHTAYTYAKNGDIYFVDAKKKIRRITETPEWESSPSFGFGEGKIVFQSQQNIFAWDIATGEILQVTNFIKGSQPPSPTAPGKKDGSNDQEKWLKEDQLELFEVLRSRKTKKDIGDSLTTAAKTKSLRAIYLEDKNLTATGISSQGRFVHYRLSKPASGARATIVPSYVTVSGFTEDIPARTKVGAPAGSQELFLYDRRKDTVYTIKTDSIPGIRDLPEYVRDYPEKFADRRKQPTLRQVNFSAVTWAPHREVAVVDIRAVDNKDRWLMLLTENGQLSLLDRQHDSAWIGGPGIGGSFGGGNYGWINDTDFWFQSEKTGYSHLYKINVDNRVATALTAGRFEVQSVLLSADKKNFYIGSNKKDPGELHYYRLSVSGGEPVQLTNMTGASQVTLSPDEKKLAFLYSYSNKPWELYIQDNRPGAKAAQITQLAVSPEFASYPWRDPEIISFTAGDGATVRGRLYKPRQANPARPAVIFVHGAGYLQNVHKWWSSYFREYMFHNLLADQGYTVLDLDYRASSGYGRNWRTGIYRFMGGKDLTDHLDGAQWLVQQLGVDPKHIGIYGGSYGGFITLMALFTSPGTFAAGAALRPVTDWAHYNHGYTANILNEPFLDSLAYRKSSPIYHASGLKDRLLICHGMVDVNVHFEDVVRLQQKLIELGKNNWELAAYPMEDHGFIEPSSWTDEYKRIFKLFEETLK